MKTSWKLDFFYSKNSSSLFTYFFKKEKIVQNFLKNKAKLGFSLSSRQFRPTLTGLIGNTCSKKMDLCLYCLIMGEEMDLCNS